MNRFLILCLPAFLFLSSSAFAVPVHMQCDALFPTSDADLRLPTQFRVELTAKPPFKAGTVVGHLWNDDPFTLNVDNLMYTSNVPDQIAQLWFKPGNNGGVSLEDYSNSGLAIFNGETMSRTLHDQFGYEIQLTVAVVNGAFVPKLIEYPLSVEANFRKYCAVSP